MDDEWVPMGASHEELAALHEGIPRWMELPFWEWFRGAIVLASQDGGDGLDLTQEYDTRRRLEHPLTPRAQSYGVEEVLAGRDDPALVISFTDFLIAKLMHWGQDVHANELEVVLEQAGSAWRVGLREGGPGLERRVPRGVQEAAESAMATPGHAGMLLSQAWHAVFGAEPNPELAYSKAVKAVEAAAVPIVVPSNRLATLGDVIRMMKTDGGWSLPLAREHPAHPTASVLLGMIQALWSGQDDRHAGQPGYKPSEQEAAETAVFLAVPLVQWFSNGIIARR